MLAFPFWLLFMSNGNLRKLADYSLRASFPGKCGCWVSAKSLQSCPALCNPYGLYLPGSSVCGVLQARILEWIAMPSSRGSSRPDPGVKPKSLTSPESVGRFFTTSTAWEALMMSAVTQLILIIPIFCMCKFSYLLKLIRNLQIHIHSVFVILHGHAQGGEKFESPNVHAPSWGWSRQSFPFLF